MREDDAFADQRAANDCPSQLKNALYFLASSLELCAVKFNRCLRSGLMMGGMEKRLAQRRRVLKAGVIVCLAGTLNCMVRNLSEQGAALDLESLIAIPHDFTLVIPSTACVTSARACGATGRASGSPSLPYIRPPSIQIA
jgi:hypothetical protein